MNEIRRKSDSNNKHTKHDDNVMMNSWEPSIRSQSDVATGGQSVGVSEYRAHHHIRGGERSLIVSHNPEY
jgi:hypothetical protein